MQSTIAAGTIRGIDAGDAQAAPGVLTVITHLADAPMTALGPPPPLPFKDHRVLHHGQHVAVVAAETPEQATAAARLVRIVYVQTVPWPAGTVTG